MSSFQVLEKDMAVCLHNIRHIKLAKKQQRNLQSHVDGQKHQTIGNKSDSFHPNWPQTELNAEQNQDNLFSTEKHYFPALLLFPPTQTTHNNANLFEPPRSDGSCQKLFWEI